MRFMKVFLASSIVEFRRERKAIEAGFNSLNSELIARGAYAEPILCEDLNDSVVPGGTQKSVIDPHIRDCDLFVLLIGQKVGNVTLGELELALGGTPRVIALFRDEPHAAETVSELRDRLRIEPRCCTATFETADDVMREIKRELDDLVVAGA